LRDEQGKVFFKEESQLAKIEEGYIPVCVPKGKFETSSLVEQLQSSYFVRK
jgi:hypothetical protein